MAIRRCNSSNGAKVTKLRVLLDSSSLLLPRLNGILTIPTLSLRTSVSSVAKHSWTIRNKLSVETAPHRFPDICTSSNKIIESVERGGGFPDRESRLMLEQGISMGRGGVLAANRAQTPRLQDSPASFWLAYNPGIVFAYRWT